MVDALVIFIETDEQIAVVRSINYSTSLPDGVHSPHRGSHINTLNSCFAGDDGTNSASTLRVISYHELLQRNILFLSDNFQQ
jgi:hypothetical protein